MSFSGAVIRVLVVAGPDAEVGIARQLRESADRFELSVCADSATAFERLESTPVDYIVGTYDLADTDGVTFLKQVRGAYPDLPFALVTNQGSEQIASDAIAHGVTEYLPVTADEPIGDRLVDRITQTVERRRSDDVGRPGGVLDAMFDQFPVHMYVKDVYGRHVRVSSGLYDPTALLGKTDAEIDLQHFKDGRKTLADDRQVIETGRPILNQVEYSPRQDRWFLTSKVPWYDETGDVNGLVGISADITERKNHQQRLEETNEVLEAIIEASPVPIVLHDLDGTVQRWNPAAESLFGWTESEAIGQSPPPFVPASKQAEFESLLEQVIDGEVISGVEVRRQTREDTLLDLRLSAAPIRPTADQITGIVGILVDITDQKERERHLERHYERLESFARVIAHDLRNPLQVAQGHLEILTDEYDHESLTTIEQAHRRMTTIIDDVLQVAQGEIFVTETAVVHLPEVVGEQWRQRASAAASIEITTENAIRADPDRLRRLFGQLFRNALDHAGPDVTVRVGATDDGFFVEDDGPGIPDSERDRVFEPGYSTDSSKTGFGLSVVKDIVTAHNWQIAITESTLGGARFDVTGVTVADAATDSDHRTW